MRFSPQNRTRGCWWEPLTGNPGISLVFREMWAPRSYTGKSPNQTPEHLDGSTIPLKPNPGLNGPPGLCQVEKSGFGNAGPPNS